MSSCKFFKDIYRTVLYSLALLCMPMTALYAGAVPAASGQTDTLAVSPADTSSVSPADSASSEDRGFDALKYTLQKRYIYRGKDFKSEKFTDNTFLSLHAGTEQFVPFGNSTYAWGLAARLSYGKWIDKYNALRLSLATEQHFRNVDRQHIWNVGFDVSHMFNLSAYFGGYNPARFFEISTVEGFRYRYSIMDGHGYHAGALHIGFNLKMNVAKNLDFFIEPLVSANSDGMDHSGGWNWRIYDIGYGGTMGVNWRFHSFEPYRCPAETRGSSFVSVSAGPQYQNSDLVYDFDGFHRSLGAQYNISYGRWFSRVFALRLTGFFAHSRWKEYIDGTRKNTLYYGARVEGMLDVIRLFTPKDRYGDGLGPHFSLSLLFGPEVGGMTKQELSDNINRLYLGLAGGVQAKYRVIDYLSVYVEPHFSVVPYNVVNESPEPLKHVGYNYYDGTFNINFGVELDLGQLKRHTEAK